MANNDSLFGALAGVVGPEHVTRLDSELAACAVDGVIPRVLVRPGSVAELRDVVRVAADNGVSITPGPPTSLDVVLSSGRLNAVVEYDVANLTLVCQAGVRVEDLRLQLSANRQFLPLDPPYTNLATVGGVVAANSSGPHRLAYGSARDLTLGM
jgi:glycolate oxidase FAD binding subunit